MPGHATSWGEANPSLIANCPLQGNTSVNPINPLIFTYIRAYIKDVFDAVYIPLNKTPIIHLGGDEVDAWCWTADAEINAYMKKNGITTV